MGVVASVMCTCFADGMTEIPPFAEHVKLDESGFLTLDLTYEHNQDKHHLFDQWLNTACKHTGMDLFSEVISNWSGYRSFQQVLAINGLKDFPTLMAELPENTGGLTDTLAAAKMLDELIAFIEQGNIGWTTMLVDTDTGQELHEYVAAQEGIFSFTPDGIEMGVDGNGFFIWRRHGDGFLELFRSMKFQQSILDTGLRKLLKRVAAEFVDLESGKKFRCRQGLFHVSHWPDGRMQDDESKFHIVYPARLHVTKRERQASEFEYIISPLRRLCEAAVKTRNPIRWH